MHNYHMTLVSANKKTGPIPVTTTSKDSCPSTCRFRGNGCYAEQGPLQIHWKRLSDGKSPNALTLEQLCGAIKALPYKQLWRHNQAGDLPKSEVSDGIHWARLEAIVKANKGRRGYTYTHYRWEVKGKLDYEARDNLEIIQRSNAQGFTINVSCETAGQADKAVSLGLPTVITVPHDAPNSWRTPAGNLVKTCPAVLYDNVTCASCGLCQKQFLAGPKGEQRPRHIVAFPAHGTAFQKLSKELRVIQ